MSKLLLISPDPVMESTNGKLILDVKFVDGMNMHVEQWDGPVACILRRGAHDVPFGAVYNRSDLNFQLELIGANDPISVDGLAKNDLILAGADMHDVLHLAAPDQRPKGTKLVYSIECDFSTRMRIASLDKSRNFLRRIRIKLWLLNQERRRRYALQNCDGIQTNGYPAFSAYGSMNNQSMLYLDGRMKQADMASSGEQAVRAAYLQSGAPLRLVHSGRLEPIKGAQDLIPIVKILLQSSIEFTLDIFGTGSLASKINEDIKKLGLNSIVRMHGAVSFDDVLVPFFRKNADLFLSCHLQSDPSCTYIESMGCGIPIVGYRNTMWRDLAKNSGGGWAVNLGKKRAIADQICKLSIDRKKLIDAGQLGLVFAKNHDFEIEFLKRTDHLNSFIA